MFDSIDAPPPDPVYDAMRRYNLDNRQERIDLGIGVFRDESGRSPLFAAVAQAERELADAERSKAYLPLAGDGQFLDALASFIFPDQKAGAALIQSTGGTGAVRLAYELVKLACPSARVHLGLPSWPNHAAIANAIGLELRTYQYADHSSSTVEFDLMLAGARSCTAGDAFILHGPGHNPTGLDLTRAQRSHILKVLGKRGAVPIIDAAYWGLCDGIEADIGELRDDLSVVPEALIAVSCSKAFGLYRERVGALFAFTDSPTKRSVIQANLERISRTQVSTAPAHGAAIVARILADGGLKMLWAGELARMRARVSELRARLGGHANEAPQLAHVSLGRGLFTVLPISADDVGHLSSDHAIHLPSSGRINITGLKTGDPERLVGALRGLAMRRS